ncbi:MAG: hypothetical protein FD126_409 [Elusimicrobia bacterium]|nr:MAG: hypothetical protein FD126_409 [Elusimicrobiota bacterium]
MRGERGSALVQVLVMSVLLTVLATGVMKVMFMNHVAVAKVQTSERMRDYAERCMAEKAALYPASPCAGNCSYNGVTVVVSCVAGGVRFDVDIP